MTGGGQCEPLSLRNVKIIWERLPSEYSDRQEALEFLAQHFGVDRLEMAIRANAVDDTQKRSELRDGLAAGFLATCSCMFDRDEY